MWKFTKEDLERWTGLKLLDWQVDCFNKVAAEEYKKFVNEILYGKPDDERPVGLFPIPEQRDDIFIAYDEWITAERIKKIEKEFRKDYGE